MVDRFRSKLLQDAGFPLHGFAKRTGGVSKGHFSSLNLAYGVGDDAVNVETNLQRLKVSLHTDMPLLRVKQVHGSNVIDASLLASEDNLSWTNPPEIEADGIVATEADVVLAVQTADCVPLLLADPNTGAVAAVHVGWRGARKGVVRSCIRAMGSKGVSAKSLVAAIGPCICMTCYEVGEEVARYFPESSDPIKGKPGKFLFDLGLAVEVFLIAAGLTSNHIGRIDACTACQTDALFSHRRTGEPTGRILSYISGAR
ncbi:MAG: peptidoglycan editing factor PgeF [Proteobacteria bacterium]|nr:peptidoglycan editing factor PgeF [Pseudomonadota bacterium]